MNSSRITRDVNVHSRTAENWSQFFITQVIINSFTNNCAGNNYRSFLLHFNHSDTVVDKNSFVDDLFTLHSSTSF